MSKFTEQEKNIIQYLQQKPNVDVKWEELAQFAKDPQNVKLKTIQRAVSEIKRKFKESNLNVPFNTKFSLLTEVSNKEQVLVQVKRSPAGNTMIVDAKRVVHPALIDFVLDRNNKGVRTKSGYYKLGDDDWEMIKYFAENVGKIVKISDLRDKVKYPQYGSKLPPRWYNSIMHIINNLRRTVPALKSRLLTTNVDGETCYLFQ
jgi:hypothetical protein